MKLGDGQADEVSSMAEDAVIEVRRKTSFKEAFLGNNVGQKDMEDGFLNEDNVSEDESSDEDKKEDNPYCPTIKVSVEEKRLRFTNDIEFDWVMFGGPWMVADRYLIVRQRQPNFDLERDVINKVLVWNTLQASRGKFARMCVEVDLSKPLLFKFCLRKWVRLIEYEDMHLVCFSCGFYGHRSENCMNGMNMECEEEGEGFILVHLRQKGMVTQRRIEVTNRL
ncbi:hypothetical protein P3X46_000929 [Hevea brasiliensis]|uniref:CCHC-type domain-containing protein n=1 Tax=Hevea brasiliensis TaxID=3981 RepID=A0ABQ9NAX4_HEVBR|nr:hypothetical protein P3X46_000929 [Hevea brasiliensis]